jgi:hypothetical protein
MRATKLLHGSLLEALDSRMPLKFFHFGSNWELRAGGPPMGCREHGELPFEAALRSAHPSLSRMSVRELASWIVARLNAITGGALESEGKVFADDTDEFGYKLKALSPSRVALAYGGIVFESGRTYLAWNGDGLGDFQVAVVALLAESPSDLARCEIKVRVPESNQSRTYGWDGQLLIIS